MLAAAADAPGYPGASAAAASTYPQQPPAVGFVPPPGPAYQPLGPAYPATQVCDLMHQCKTVQCHIG